MNQTTFLNKVKQMRFEEAYEGYQAKRLSQLEAATLLGVCDRSFRCYIHQYEDSGMEGLLDQRMDQPSHRKASVDEVIKLQDLYSTRYQGWNVRHFHTWYQREHEGKRSYSWVKNELQGAKLVRKSKSRGPYRIKRLPSALPGMMIHQDGSTHQWVPGVYWDL
ncbi:MAG: transposase, partial [Parvicella sp.]